jgi:hypothetical protein
LLGGLQCLHLLQVVGEGTIPPQILPSPSFPRELLQVRGEGTISPPILPSPSFSRDDEFQQLLQVGGEGPSPHTILPSSRLPRDEERLQLLQVGGESSSPPPSDFKLPGANTNPHHPHSHFSPPPVFPEMKNAYNYCR